jgi:hypothetical protein
LTGGILALIRGQDLAKDHFIDFACFGLGAAKRRFDHRGAKIMRGRRYEGAVERPDGRTRRAYDNYFLGHCRILLKFWPPKFRLRCAHERFSQYVIIAKRRPRAMLSTLVSQRRGNFASDITPEFA